MRRSRPKLGYDYRVIVIHPDSRQDTRTRYVGPTDKIVMHREAMRVMKECKANRAPGAVVRMLRIPFEDTFPNAWSDDGKTWRWFSSDEGNAYNDSIEAVRREGKAAT